MISLNGFWVLEEIGPKQSKGFRVTSSDLELAWRRTVAGTERTSEATLLSRINYRQNLLIEILAIKNAVAPCSR